MLYLHRSYRKIVLNFSSDIKVRRCWIPSGVKWRPLGIAPLAWRIYTRGLANILETFLANGWPENQHAYTTGRGVGSAWKVILKKVIHYKYIYEYDYSGFFNTINLSVVGKTLLSYKTPKYITIHLLGLSSSDVANIGYGTLAAHLSGSEVEEDFGSA